MNELETDAQKVLQMEAEAILDLIPRVDEHFDAAVDMILACEGRVIMTGMGKSGIIAHKISATLASTGTPSFYLHPAEGIHGDLGMVTADDVIIALSNSGETGEVLNILPSIRRIGAKLVAMVGNTDSTLAQNADVVLNVGVKKEACPWDWLPLPALLRLWLSETRWLWRSWGNIILPPISLPYSIPAEAWAGSFC